VEKTLMVVAALAALVAVVATTVAWRAGRRARRAADLVSQLLDPPVVEPRTSTVEPRANSALEAVADPELPAAIVWDDDAPLDPPTVSYDPPPSGDRASADRAIHDGAIHDGAIHDREPVDSRRTFGSGAGVGAAFDRADPAPARIPVLDLDRLRSWLTLGDVNLGRLAVVSVELDNLGFVQERLGYAAGAHLLEAITQRLRTVTRPRDVVAHVNQERFVLVTTRPPKDWPNASPWALLTPRSSSPAWPR